MKYNTLKVTKKGSLKRVGRGIAAGQGKTAGRGTKGQKSRAGATRKLGFEGGQNPLIQRLPKLRGFNRPDRNQSNVYTDQLEKIKSAIVDNAALVEAGLIDNAHTTVKLIQRGELKKKQTVNLQAASKGAIAQIEKAGGKFTATPRVGRTAKKSAKKDK